MKTEKQIIKSTPVFLHNWTNEEQVFKDFNTDKDGNILFASYGQDNYSGEAWVLLEKDGELYEASGSHCSCYGLEGQWSPEKVVLTEIENRLSKGNFGTDSYSDNYFKDELIKFLKI